ncbi:hypothetical protein NEIG_00881 [Nematocida sp. ERTm5]|nr:hypothetical protein NEIG_00881 [Nematocida sp. ERTm5]
MNPENIRRVVVIISILLFGYFNVSLAAERQIEADLEEYKEVINRYTDTRIDAVHSHIIDLMKRFNQTKTEGHFSVIPESIKNSWDLLEMFSQSPTSEIKEILSELRSTLNSMENILDLSELEESSSQSVDLAYETIRSVGDDMHELIQFYLIIDININRMESFISQAKEKSTQ